MTTPTTPNTRPSLDAISPPAGTEVDAWEHANSRDYRLAYGTTRRQVPGRDDVYVQPVAVQLDDGSIDDGNVVEGPGVHVGLSNEPLTIGQARQLARDILAAADFLAALAPNPADPLDGVPAAAFTEAIVRRVRRVEALRQQMRAALLSAPARLGDDERAVLLGLVDEAGEAIAGSGAT